MNGFAQMGHGCWPLPSPSFETTHVEARMLTRRRIIALGLVVGITLSGCVDQNLIGPTDAELAKGGIPGAPGDSEEPVELLEYYVYHPEPGKNFVHVLASGTFPRLNLNVVQDYIYNGIADDDYSVFYEIYNSAPYVAGPEDLGEENEGVWEEVGDNIWHIDIPWHGKAYYRIYADPMDPNPILDSVPFPNYPYANVDGLGGDPYAFYARFQQENGDFIAGFQPQGIILDGEVRMDSEQRNVKELTLQDGPHAGKTIHSYAIHQGGEPAHTFSVDQVIVHENSVTCDVKTVKERIDKTFVTKTVAQVSVSAQVILKNYTPGALGSFTWVYVMLASDTIGSDGPEFYDSFTTPRDPDSWANGSTVGAQIEGTEPPTMLRLAIPYIYSTDVQGQVVYDPGNNTDELQQGWNTYQGSGLYESTQPDDVPSAWYQFPYVLTDPFPVNCGK
jgi:hypothetical protein